MNDEHDNALDDKEVLRRVTEKGPQEEMPWRWADAAGTTSGLRGTETGDMQELEEEKNIQATIKAKMSDLEIANEVIRVAGYERTEHIAAILFDRTIAQS